MIQAMEQSLWTFRSPLLKRTQLRRLHALNDEATTAAQGVAGHLKVKLCFGIIKWASIF